MKVTDILAQAESPLFTFELLPPRTGHSIEKIYETIDILREYNPAYINFTYHREEKVYREREDGLVERYSVRKRPGTIALSAAVRYKYNIEVVPHIICGGFSREETEEALIELNFLGIHNVFALRGDPEHGERRFVPKHQGHSHASELIEQISRMNDGVYLDPDLKNPQKTDFCVGAAGYPEKHFEAPNLEQDLSFLKQKVEAGAEYIVTQLFFENKYFFNFVDACRAEGINVPIIPGIKPISSLRDIALLPQTFGINLPNELVKDVKKCGSNKEARALGVEYAVQQTRELIEYGVPAVHFYTLGRARNIAQIVRTVF